MRSRATQNYLPSLCPHASVSCQHCFSFEYHTHLLHGPLEDDPFKKRQNRKANFPPSGPAKQTRNPQIKHSLSASNRCCNVLPPSPLLHSSPGNGQYGCGWCFAWGDARRRAKAKRYSAPAFPSSLIYQTQAGEKQLIFFLGDT